MSSPRTKGLGLDSQIKSEAGQASRRLVEALIRQKCINLNVMLSVAQDESLRAFVANASVANIAWLDDLPTELAFTDQEWASIDAQVRDLLAIMPANIKAIVSEVSADLLKTVRADWRKRKFDVEAELTAFRIRLKNRWQAAFDELSLVQVLCREIGQEELERLGRSRARIGKVKRDAILRLHARACQISGEIMSLIEAGYADGAMARWRTLHELFVVASVLASGNDELAQRYRDHEVVDSKKAMDLYVRDHEELGFAAPSQRDISDTTQTYQVYIQKYGKSFGNSYGWAADHLKIKNPTFADLQHAAGRGAMTSFYKMASYPIHADAKGLYWRLAALGHTQEFLAGPSNAGFDEPGQNMAVSLVAVTALLRSGRKLDDTVPLAMLGLQRDKAIKALVSAGKQLAADERRTRRP